MLISARFCSAFSLIVASSLICALFALRNCAHRGSVAEHWPQATGVTSLTSSHASLPHPAGPTARTSDSAREESPRRASGGIKRAPCALSKQVIHCSRCALACLQPRASPVSRLIVLGYRFPVFPYHDHTGSNSRNYNQNSDRLCDPEKAGRQ